MKKMIAVLLFLALLSGCGSPAVSPAGSSSGAGASSSAPNDSLISENDVKAALVGQGTPCKYKAVVLDEVSEIDDDEFTITEITQLSYTVEKGKEDNWRTVTGTFSALGTILGNGEPKATVDPVKFKISMCTDLEFKSPPKDLLLEQIPHIKPANPIDIENLSQYLNQKNSRSYYQTINPDYIDAQTTPFELPVLSHNVDFGDPNIRFEVTNDPFPDDELVARRLEIKVYNGDTYLCKGKISTSQYSKPQITISLETISS